MSPWIGLRLPLVPVKLAALAAQTHRRFVNTHLPVDALVYSPRAKYLYIGRGGRDVMWSRYNHQVGAKDLWYRLINETPNRVGPPIGKPPESVRQYFPGWLDGVGYPFWPFWANIASWWEIRELPNLMVLHCEQMRLDLPGQTAADRQLPRYRIDEDQFPTVIEHCSFAWSKANATKSTPLGGAVWDGGADVHQPGHQWPLARLAHARRRGKLRGDGAGAGWPAVRTVAGSRDGGISRLLECIASVGGEAQALCRGGR